MDVNLNLYKYFLAVMETCSVSLTAKRMGVSQPTVSYNLHALQRDLGHRLFTLEKNGLRPTPQAVKLYQDLEPIYGQFLQIIVNFINPR